MKAARTEQPAAHAGDKCESQYLLSGVRSRFKVLLLSRAQITREAVYGANQVADQFGWARGLAAIHRHVSFSWLIAR